MEHLSTGAARPLTGSDWHRVRKLLVREDADSALDYLLDEEAFDAVQRENADQPYHLDWLLEQLASPQQLVPFVGAGMSLACGLPGWLDFLKAQAREAGVEARIQKLLAADQYEEAADAVLEARGRRAFEDALEYVFGDSRIQSRGLLSAVSVLPYLTEGPVITTNFDHVLEKVFALAGLPFEDVVVGAKADEYVKAHVRNRRVLLKVHGDVKGGTDRILTKQDYERHYGPRSGGGEPRPLPLLLRQMMKNRPLLFLGCSLVADRTVHQLEAIAEELGSVPHYAIFTRPETHAFHERSRRLARLNIRPIWLPAGGYGLLGPFLGALVARSHPRLPIVRLARAWRKEELDKVAGLGEEILRKEPESLLVSEVTADALFGRAVGILIREKKPTVASLQQVRRLLERGVELSPDQHDAHYVLGAVELVLGYEHDAAERLEKALALGTREAGAYLACGLAHMLEGDYERGSARLDEALAKKSDDSDNKFLVFVAHLAKGDVERASAVFATLADEDGSFPLEQSWYRMWASALRRSPRLVKKGAQAWCRLAFKQYWVAGRLGLLRDFLREILWT